MIRVRKRWAGSKFGGGGLWKWGEGFHQNKVIKRYSVSNVRKQEDQYVMMCAEQWERWDGDCPL